MARLRPCDGAKDVCSSGLSCSTRERHVAHIALFHLWKEDRDWWDFHDDPTSGRTLRDACRDYIEAMAIDSDEDDQDDGYDDET
ncbi:hypothetical protein [Bradyrhizobium sp. WSM1417]|uniref:hypothetical protein n=1 Tax=Bradyrhizobium sp. WSM1417 TaxID=754500 RepID=UPI0012EB697D|nr:hypothetical protein [Bradyrhizobium sp. WSM1417]